ncbi:hypothetical protein BC835DRAFT_1417457 [Cytidiella melzeri]|nr:hypothetical protein BC835DRAFT_1417457 [Cytidiella melzeri]
MSRASPTSIDSEASEYGSVDYPTPVSLADVTEPDSLKRKHRDEEDIDNSNDGELSTPPPKRLCSSPGAEEQLVAEKPGPVELAMEPTPQLSDEIIPPVIGQAATEPETAPPARTATPVLNKATFNIPAYKPSTAFSAFAGSSSPFLLATSSATSQRPAWCSNGTLVEQVVSKEVEMARDDISAQVAESSGIPAEASDDPLAAHSRTQSTQTSISGEEDEETTAELKGVKLFVKRGKKEFSTGMLGHVKLLCDKTSKEERLVFRREPVWKVSMSVRLRPSIRCSFDEEQGVLRITLKETDEESGDQHVVIYALKRGKIPKPDFTVFVQTVLDSSQLSGSTKPLA